MSESKIIVLSTERGGRARTIFEFSPEKGSGYVVEQHQNSRGEWDQDHGAGLTLSRDEINALMNAVNPFTGQIVIEEQGGSYEPDSRLIQIAIDLLNMAHAGTDHMFCLLESNRSKPDFKLAPESLERLNVFLDGSDYKVVRHGETLESAFQEITYHNMSDALQGQDDPPEQKPGLLWNIREEKWE